MSALGLVANSQYQASPPLESVRDRSLRNLQGVPHLSPQYSSPHPRQSPCVGCVTGAVVSGRHSGSPDSELFVSLTRVRWLLFDSHMGHTLFPAWADTHTRTATFRACGYIGVIASAPLSIRNGWKPQYDGAYPRREQAWYCACTIYNSDYWKPIHRVHPIWLTRYYCNEYSYRPFTHIRLDIIYNVYYILN